MILSWDFIKHIKGIVIAERMILQVTWKEHQVQISIFDTSNSSLQDFTLSIILYYAKDVEFEKIYAITIFIIKTLGNIFLDESMICIIK